MSFEFNSVATFKPKVENTFLNKGGGGGNTGYFQQGKKKKDEEKSIMAGFLSEDTLERMSNAGLPQEEENGLLDKFKNFVGKIV